jgi:hypothetical protein
MIRKPESHFCAPAFLVPASAAVPAASTQQKQYKHNDKKCGEIHDWPPRLLLTSHAFGLAKQRSDAVNCSTVGLCGLLREIAREGIFCL